MRFESGAEAGYAQRYFPVRAQPYTGTRDLQAEVSNLTRERKIIVRFCSFVVYYLRRVTPVVSLRRSPFPPWWLVANAIIKISLPLLSRDHFVGRRTWGIRKGRTPRSPIRMFGAGWFLSIVGKQDVRTRYGAKLVCVRARSVRGMSVLLASLPGNGIGTTLTF